MKNLIKLRTDRGLTLSELARLAGISPAAICRIEPGQRQPRPKTRRKLAKALKVEPSEITF